MRSIYLAVAITILTLVGCDEPIIMSDEEKQEIANVTCSILQETRGMDAAVRVEKVNDARKSIGEEPFLDGDKEIMWSLWWGLCPELVLNDPDYEFKKEVEESFDDFECPDRSDPMFFARDEIEDRKTRALVELCASGRRDAEELPPSRR